MLLQKEIKVTLQMWMDGNEDWVIISKQDPDGKKCSYSVVPTEVIIPGGKDIEKIQKLIDSYIKTFPKHVKRPFRVVSKEYLKYYLDGISSQFNDYDKAYLSWNDAVEMIKSGKYDQIVIDAIGLNGFLYDKNKKKIPRCLHIDQIQMHGQLRYNNPKRLTPEKIYKYLEKHSQVVDLHWEDIPYYNQDDDGKITRVPVFSFKPSGNKQFLNIVNIENRFNIENEIFKRLKILDKEGEV